VRLVDEDNINAALSGMEFEDSELLDYNGGKILVYKDLIITGENITSATPNTDEKGQSIISLTLDSSGAERFRIATKENVGKKIAMILVEKDSKQVVTAPSVNEEIGGGRVQITGTRSLAEASQQAALLRAGALAAPMQIIEERTLAPSLGEENIKKGINATVYGFIAVFIFMMFYYRVFGITAALALGANLLLLIGVLSGLQATLTLPGIAAIALTLGMAIDSNVLINERIREELRDGASPQKAILAGYENAWRTILDSNVTTFIVGMMLLTFGTGPIKGFAIVHCVGILTSMFSAVLVSRALVNLSHGGRRLNTLWI
jgi:preprotein translocase subunit SecD